MLKLVLNRVLVDFLADNCFVLLFLCSTMNSSAIMDFPGTFSYYIHTCSCMCFILWKIQDLMAIASLCLYFCRLWKNQPNKIYSCTSRWGHSRFRLSCHLIGELQMLLQQILIVPSSKYVLLACHCIHYSSLTSVLLLGWTVFGRQISCAFSPA